jgi:sulfotransferase family protein
VTGNPRPLFLLSPPRSGSTLVQRVLATHAEVATSNEPWVLLPQIYALRERGAYAEYGQVPASRAIQEFAQSLPGGVEDYREALRGFVLHLYRQASHPGATYFLDKTPRYAFIAEDLFQLFPDAAFVFLWRSPLSVLSSVVETWGRGRWMIHRWRVDLFDGVSRLAAARKEHQDTSYAIRYEDLVADPDSAWPELFSYLGLTFDPASLTGFHRKEYAGRMGDPSGQKRYRELSAEPLDKWRRTLCNPYRKAWAHRYLEWIGAERLALMGYDLTALLRELDALPAGGRRMASDLVRSAYSRRATGRRRRFADRLARPGKW